MKLLINYVKKYKKLLFLALLFAAINQIFSLLDPQIFRLIIDNYASKVDELDQTTFLKGVSLLVLAGVGVALISRIAKNIQDYLVNVITQRVGTNMYADSVGHVFTLPFETFEDRRSGEILQKLQKARTDSQAIIASSINVLFLSAVGVIFVLIYSMFVHWSIALSFALFIPALGFFVFQLSKKIKEAQHNIVKQSAELAGQTTETLRNVELVKSLGLEHQEIGRLNDVNDKILALELKKILIIRRLSFIQGTLVNATRAIIMVLMLYLISAGVITLGEFFSLLFYSFFVFAPLGELATVVAQYQEAKASNAQLAEILKIESKEQPKNAKEIGPLSKIEFKKVGFSYNGAKVASVKNINFKLGQGETIAFAGPSGSGKSTLLKLLVGLYDPKLGKIEINGVNSEKLNYEKIRKNISFVSQETQLFAGTIRENLLFVNPNATEKDMLEALKLASASTIITRAKKGLNTKIGEGGIKLSGGERQRLAIARALLRNPQLIIFDEATSSLDSLTEQEITETIQEIRKSRKTLLTVIVAHRLSTILHADKIYVLENGKIIEEGTHEELLKKKGLYKAMWRQQSETGNGKKKK